MFTRLKTFPRDMWVEARRDFCSVRWRTVLLWRLPMTIWSLGLVALLIILGFVKNFVGQYGLACTPDGQFSLSPDRYNYWSAGGIFQITLAYGNLVSTSVRD
jgi:hypothetical protein